MLRVVGAVSQCHSRLVRELMTALPDPPSPLLQRWCCNTQGVAANEEDSRPATSVHHQHTFEAIKPAEKHSAEGRQAFLLVRMAGSSSGGADSSSNPSSASSDTCTDEPEVWHDCTDSQEWFQAGGEAQTLASSAAAEQPTAAPGHLTAEQAACLQALPTRLCALLTKYLQVSSCTPCCSLWCCDPRRPVGMFLSCVGHVSQLR